MSTSQWILLALVTGLAFGGVAWFLAMRRVNAKLRDYASIREASASAKRSLEETEVALLKTSGDLDGKRTELAQVEGRTAELLALETKASEIRDTVANGNQLIQSVSQELLIAKESKSDVERNLQELKSEADLYTRVADFIDFGVFEEPEYLYETSERYKIEIKAVRDKQKEMIATKTAIELPPDVLVDGSSQKGKSILAGQAKMMLRAFNIECDFLIAKVNPSNLARTLERIEKAADSLEKSALSLMCGVSPKYVELKYEECSLFYQFVLKRTEEQEEQRQIREQIREEQKAIREYERARVAAEKEERMYAALLEKARAELEQAQDSERAEFETKISVLEQQLREAREKEERARSLAEQTRRGHVYVISNIGSFGDEIYKIGLTRRLDPMDRVKELGDASVPFPFDVHAVIYSEDAPKLEATLHRKFNDRRVNAVNRRKEFFRVNLDEVKNVVDEARDRDTEFRITALAEQYYETLRLQGAGTSAV